MLLLSAKRLVLLTCVGLALVAVAVAEAQGPEPTSASGGSGQGLSAESGGSLLYDEEEAQAIDRMLMCPVCPAVTIDQTQVELAQQMRRLVREMLAQGASRQQIQDFFVERYGPGVLAAPSKGGFNLLAWILPAVGVVVALGALFLVLRSMVGHSRQEGGEIPPTPLYQRGARGDLSVAGELPLGEELAPYLKVIDQELSDPPRGKGGLADAHGVARGKAPAGVWGVPRFAAGGFFPLFRRRERGTEGVRVRRGRWEEGSPAPRQGDSDGNG